MVPKMTDLKELSQSQVPLERVAPLQSNRLVTFVNHFIVSIVQQLNELSSVVDSRLFDINNQIFRCNANLVILEMKLNSISGLSSSAANADVTQTVPPMNSSPVPQIMPQTDANDTEELKNSAIDSVKTEAISEPTKTEPNDNSEDKEETEESSPQPEDPRLAKYKKMLHLGIPLAAVQQKMSLEGVDPQLIS